MGTVVRELSVPNWFPAATAGALPSFVEGTNFPVQSWAFDGGATDNIIYTKITLLAYGSGDLTFNIHWQGDTATTGDVKWGIALAAITPNTDTQDVETKSFATATTVVDTHLGTTAKRAHDIAITVTGASLDSVANGDELWIKLYRVASDTANDTMAGYAKLLCAHMSYSDV